MLRPVRPKNKHNRFFDGWLSVSVHALEFVHQLDFFGGIMNAALIALADALAADPAVSEDTRAAAHGLLKAAQAAEADVARMCDDAMIYMES
jgi:hypothetical protein